MQLFRKIILAISAVIIGVLGCEQIRTKSVSLPITPSGLNLIYSVTWGWNMEQGICLSRGACWPWSVTSPRSEVWKKPYNAKAPLYVSGDGKTYYAGHNWGAWRIHPAGRTIKILCNAQAVADDMQTTESRTNVGIPPGAVPSELYDNLFYVGLFRVTYRTPSTKGRGDGVAFFPHDQEPEPKDGIGTCG